MQPLTKPILILAAIVAALLLVQSISAPYKQQISEARESAAIQAQQAEAVTKSVAAKKERARQAQRKKQEATDAAQKQSDFHDPGSRSLIVFLKRLLP